LFAAVGLGRRIARHLLYQRPELRAPIPDRRDIATAANRIEVYRLDTCSTDLLDEVLARGEVVSRTTGAGTYPISGGLDPLAELQALTRRPGAPGDSLPPIRVLLLHHPVHRFPVPNGGSEGGLDRAGALAARLEGLGFHMVVAGHRHHRDPLAGGPAGGIAQPPLPSGIVQLVSDSPTQDGGDPTIPNWFSVYELHVEPASATLDIRRLDYEYTDADGAFMLRDEFWLSGLELQ
jgi:hypothetical protein